MASGSSRLSRRSWGWDSRASRGGAADFRGVNLRSDGERTGGGARSPKASGMLMVDGVLYLVGAQRGKCATRCGREDRGKTWQWGFKMEDGFGSPAFLNFGRNYAGARDGFVYTYSQDGPSAYESDNGVMLARVAEGPDSRARGVGVFRGLGCGRASGVDQRMSTRRGTVFDYPANCERVDVVYDAGIRRYLMALGYDHAGGWGLFDAPEPWGPWTTVLHRAVGHRRGRMDIVCRRSGFPRDGLTMTLVFSGVKPNDAFCTRTLRLTK